MSNKRLKLQSNTRNECTFKASDKRKRKEKIRAEIDARTANKDDDDLDRTQTLRTESKRGY